MEFCLDVRQWRSGPGRRFEDWVGAQIPSKLLPQDANIVKEAAKSNRVALIFCRESSDRGALGVVVFTGQMKRSLLDLMTAQPAAVIQVPPRQLVDTPAEYNDDAAEDTPVEDWQGEESINPEGKVPGVEGA